MKRLLSTSLLISFLFGVDKIVALARQVIIARYFGLDPVLDAYNASNNLPDTLFALISGGALAIAFIPVLTETLTTAGRAGAWKLFSLVANLAFVITAVIAALIALFPLVLVQRVVTPGFPLAQQLLVADLMRLNIIATLFFSLSGLITGALQAQQHFLLPALAPVLYNVGQIIGVVSLKPRFGIHGLAYGVILGAMLHLAIQIPGLVKYQFRWTPRLTLAEVGVRKVLRLMGPRVFTLAFINFIFILNDRIASGLGGGAISALTYAWTILQLPETVIGTAIGTALLPTLSELVTVGKAAELKQLLRRAITILILITIPVTLLSLVLVRPAVKLVFEGRAFTAQNSELVIYAARLMLLGLTGHSLVEIAGRAFYAHQDARTPFYLAALTLILFVVFALLLSPFLNFAALALANALAFTAEAVFMLVILHRRSIL